MRLPRPSKSGILFWIGVLGSIASILSLFTSFFADPDWRGLYIAISATVYILALLGIEVYILIERGRLLREREAMAEASRRAQAYQGTFELMHSIFHRLRDVMFEMEKTPPQPGDNFDEALCEHILDVLRTIFERITGARCSTCIKAFDKNANSLATIARDSISSTTRGSIDHGRISQVSENTDFELIMQGHQRYFLCNDLITLSESGLYKNDRPDWRAHYRSTMVLPIRCLDKGIRKHVLFGFLCIDSIQPDIFDPHFAPQVGACIADIVYLYFSKVDAVRNANP